MRLPAVSYAHTQAALFLGCCAAAGAAAGLLVTGCRILLTRP